MKVLQTLKKIDKWHVILHETTNNTISLKLTNYTKTETIVIKRIKDSEKFDIVLPPSATSQMKTYLNNHRNYLFYMYNDNLF